MYRRKPQGWMKHADFIVLDLLCLNIALVMAYITRLSWGAVSDGEAYLSIAAVYTLADLLMIILNSTYKNVLKRGKYKELAETAQHVFLVELVVSFYLFSMKEGATYSRIIIYLLAGYYFLLSYAVRLVWKRVIRRKGTLAKKAALYLITTSDRAEAVIRNIEKQAKGEFLIQGMCILDKDCIGETFAEVPVTSNADTVLDFLCDKWVDEIYVSIPAHQAYSEEMINSLVEMGIVVHVEMENMRHSGWQKQAIEQIAGQTVRTISVSMATTKQAIFKRTLDIVGGFVGCVLTLLLTIVIGPVIYFQSPGPIFFAQTRVGKNGKKFKMYKFRTMYMDAEERKKELLAQNRVSSGMMFKVDYDPRIIGNKRYEDGTVKKGIGSFLRENSLDEFPQMFNILRGDMSLVGTRPPTVDEWEKYELHHRARLAFRPGVTGLWQVSGRSNITDFEEVVKLDTKYIDEWNIGLDIKILLKTVKAVFGSDGAM